jgi:DNA polymerase III sliding clamp (beta) subunit (PCNA family)
VAAVEFIKSTPCIAVEVKLDWDKLEEVVERTVKKARTEELKDVGPQDVGRVHEDRL